MRYKNLFYFVLATAIFFFAAAHRWEDSAHSIGIIKGSGGTARHAAELDSSYDRSMLIATATIVPPYRGSAEISLEGDPPIPYRLHLSGPVIDLGLRRHPVLQGNVLHDLQPGDRIALWVEMRPPKLDPVCGMAYQDGFIPSRHGGEPVFFCCEECRKSFEQNPGAHIGKENIRGSYALAFHDTRSGKPVLTIPVIFGKGKKNDAAEHIH